MSLQVGELYAALVLDKSKFKNELDGAGKDAQSFGGKLESTLKNTAKIAAAAFAAMAAGATALAVDGVKTATEFYKASARVAAITGENITESSKLVAVLQRYKIDGDDAIKMIGKLELSVGKLTATTKTETAFEKAYGVSLRDSNGHVKNASELLGVAADIFTNKSIPATKKAMAESQLFGKSWQSLVPILKLGSKGLKDAQEQAAELGLVLTESNAKDLAEYRNSTIEMDEAMGGLRLQIGLAVMPIFRTFATFMTNNVVPAVRIIVTAIHDWVSANKPLIENVLGLAGTITNILQGALKVFLGLVTQIVRQLQQYLIPIIAQVLKVAKPVFDALVNVVDLFADAISDITADVGAWQDGVAELTFQGNILGATIYKIVGAIYQFIGDGNNWRDILETIGIVLGVVLAPILASFIAGLAAAAAGAVVAAAPFIALGAALYLLVKWLNDSGVGAKLLKIATEALSKAIDWVSKNVIPALIDAFNYFVENILPVLIDGFNYFANVILPQVAAMVQQFIANAIVVLQDAVNFFITNIWPLLIQAFDYVSTVVVPALIAAFNWFIQNVLPQLVAAIQNIAAVVIPILNDAFNFLVNTVLPAVVAAIDWISKNVLPALAAAFDWLTKNVIPALAAIFQWLVNDVLPPVIKIIQDIGSIVQSVFGFLQPYIQGALKFIADLFTTAFQAIWNIVSTILKTIQDLWKTFGDDIMNIVGVLIAYVQNTINNGLKIVQGIFDTFAALFRGDWSGVWNGIQKIFSGIIDQIVNIFRTAINLLPGILDAAGKILSGAWDALWGGFKTGLGAIWDGIVGIIKGSVNTIIGLVNILISAIDSIQLHLHMSIPNPLGGDLAQMNFDWNGFGIPKIPMLAKGTPNWKGGWALLGERGPELARLPAGTQVFPAGKTRDMMGGAGGGGPLIGEQHIYGTTPDEVERQTTRAIRRAALEWSLEGR